ncbi:MAG: ABC transporter permease [Desulfuromonadales bacterium]|nr:ABC transporter permease [Desulfuromonadales bacterium]
MIKRFYEKITGTIPESNQLERIWIIAKTDFSERYYGTKLGIVWAFLNPLFTISVYYVAFKFIFQVSIPNFILYVFSGFIIYFFFSEATVKGMLILKTKLYLIENIRFNPINIFFASILSNLYSLIFNFSIYFLISFLFPVTYSWNALFFPLLIVNLIVILLGVNLLLSALYIYIRDISHIWDMILLVIFWTSPIFYSKEILLDNFKFIIYLNPISGIIINVREVLLYNRFPDFSIFFYDMLFALILLVLSVIVFRKLSTKAVEVL